MGSIAVSTELSMSQVFPTIWRCWTNNDVCFLINASGQKKGTLFVSAADRIKCFWNFGFGRKFLCGSYLVFRLKYGI